MQDQRRPRWRASAELQQRARVLRHELTPAERKLWLHLRCRQVCGQRFRKQHAVGPFIVDFFCAEAKLAIEVDGDTHADQGEYDAERTRWLREQKGYRVLRFTNEEVHRSIEEVVMRIAAALVEPPP